MEKDEGLKNPDAGHCIGRPGRVFFGSILSHTHSFFAFVFLEFLRIGWEKKQSGAVAMATTWLMASRVLRVLRMRWYGYGYGIMGWDTALH